MICGTYDTYIITDMKVATQPRVFICLSDIRDSSFIKFYLPCTPRNISRHVLMHKIKTVSILRFNNRECKNFGTMLRRCKLSQDCDSAFSLLCSVFIREKDLFKRSKVNESTIFSHQKALILRITVINHSAKSTSLMVCFWSFLLER